MRSIFGTRKRAGGALCICVGLAIAAFGAGCGDDDDDDNDNPMEPALTGPEGVEASSGVAISTVKSLQTLFTTGSDPTGGGGRRKTSEMKPLELVWEIVRARGAAKDDSPFATMIDCPDGGTADSACFVIGDLSTGSLTFNDCRFDDETEDVTFDGSIAIAVNSISFCDDGEVPDDGRVSIALNDFSVTVKNDVGVTIGHLFADFTMATENEGGGCAGNDASISMDGTIDSFAPGEGVDAQIVADELLMSVSSESEGEGMPCVVTMMVDGGLTATDRAGERTVHAAYDDLVMTVTELANERADFTIDGGVVADCLGSIEFETLEPITFVGGATCPVDGTIEVTLDDNSKGRISFLVSGGIAFDYGADGTVDATLASCHHEDIRDCEVAAR